VGAAGGQGPAGRAGGGLLDLPVGGLLDTVVGFEPMNSIPDAIDIMFKKKSPEEMVSRSFSNFARLMVSG
jgi:hypothetical protein